jgi:general secretion pathway protein G
MQSTIERLRARRANLEGREGGFTLIELLIVIVVLGILAAIVVFAVQNLTGQSTASGCQSDYKTVETAAEAYKAQMGSYPTDITTMTKTGIQPGSGAAVGPWLKDTITSSHYTMTISADKAASPDGVIQVTTNGSNPVTTPANGNVYSAGPPAVPAAGAQGIGAGQVTPLGAAATCTGVQ